MQEIKFYSTNLIAKNVNVKEAVLKGLAEDKGLYMPDKIPALTEKELAELKNADYPEIAFAILKKFLSNFVSDDELKKICDDAYDFPVPIEKIADNISIMRLDKGPTAAFKDFAARAMARLMELFLEQENKKLLILTATSGDTGSAVANAFHGCESIKLIVLFPEKEITDRQRKLMTTLGDNISVVAIDGKFDDCQALVKDAFVDTDLTGLNLSSANSINFARLMPQIVYYVYAYLKLDKEINVCIPSGNFGNLMGGLIAKKMGVPIKKFIVAVNENDEVANFFKTQLYEKIEPSKNCISNAMNVGHPSNLSRLIALYGGIMDEKGSIKKMPDMEKIHRDMNCYSVSDEETKQEIKSIYKKYGVIVEPHGAVGLKAMKNYIAETSDSTPVVCVETADPAKFPEVIREVINIDPPLPESMREAMEKEENYEKMACDYETFKKFIVSSS
ncbi:MAG: threonine synthase [Chlamydiae bacterium]|nr:MAG: threonine synthase [Chlamydiota bacterium]